MKGTSKKILDDNLWVDRQLITTNNANNILRQQADSSIIKPQQHRSVIITLFRISIVYLNV